jgi:ubiquinone/menaquinone biosynthesis C-methylase UbiE
MTNSISFDRAADFYDQTRDLAEAVATHGIPALLKLLSPHEAGRILDVGVGTGRIAVPLIDLGADVIGIDLSLKMMAKLREKQPMARLAQADAARLPFADRTFDAALTAHVLHLIGPWREALHEFKRVIKPGGVYLNVWHRHSAHSVRQAVHDEWRQRAKARGVDWRRPGAQLPDEVIAELKAWGRFEEIELVRYDTTSTARFELERIASRVMSEAWQVPDEIYDATLNETRAWAAREFGDLDQPVTEERHFIVQVVRFS